MKSRYQESPQQLILDFIENKPNENVAEDGTRPIREYMLRESEQQYRDYYESDAEE